VCVAKFSFLSHNIYNIIETVSIFAQHGSSCASCCHTEKIGFTKTPKQQNNTGMILLWRNFVVLHVNIIVMSSFAAEMSLSRDSIVYVSRTTASDIMCVTNTSIPARSGHEDPPTKTLKAAATLPYTDNSKPVLTAGNTSFEQYRTVNLKTKRTDEMKKERDAFFAKLEHERMDKIQRENKAIVMIQALVRGFLKRPRPEYEKKHKRNPLKVMAINSQERRQIQEELCDHAAGLGLKPIPGLSLETRSKQNKRRNKIELAASLRLQAFFRMTCVILQMRKNMKIAKDNLLYDATTKITRFIRYAGKKVRQSRMMEENQHVAATKIQTRFRMFVAFQRYVCATSCVLCYRVSSIETNMLCDALIE
jgi:hypothetical protein